MVTIYQTPPPERVLLPGSYRRCLGMRLRWRASRAFDTNSALGRATRMVKQPPRVVCDREFWLGKCKPAYNRFSRYVSDVYFSCETGGEGGIRTRVTRKRKLVFKTSALSRSATSPREVCVGYSALRKGLERHVIRVTEFGRNLNSQTFCQRTDSIAFPNSTAATSCKPGIRRE